MKGLFERSGRNLQALGIVILLLCPGLISTSRATVYTLSDGNSSVSISPGTQAGMLNWSVDSVNQLYQQWFWYRIGSTGPEQSIDTISPAAITPTANMLSTTYTVATFNLNVTYSLKGGAAGSGVSDVGEQITINNTSASTLAFHFFQYSDFDLGGVPSGDIIRLGKNFLGKYNEALQSKGNISLTETFADTVATPGADHGEAAVFNQTITELNDANPTTLNDNAGPLGPDDVTWAFEWDLNIAPGSSVIISKDKNLQVPEPSALALIGLGVAGWFFQKRRS